MKILYFKWNSFGADDIQNAFTNLGHEVTVSPWDQNTMYRNREIQEKIICELDNNRFDIAFSFDYYPPIAEACNCVRVPYVAWIYDSPYVSLYSCTTVYETNRIFVFDREVFEEFRRNSINTVYYMPLAANPNRLRKLIENEEQQRLFRNSIFNNCSDIAFVGAMYDEENTFFRRLDGILDRTRGYLEGIIAVQKQILGYNFVRDMMNDEILDDMHKAYPLKFDKDCVAGLDYVYAEYCINREITARERLEYIKEIARRFSKDGKLVLDLYTFNENLNICGVYNHGFVGPDKIAPFVYDRAKINLNITLRSIHTGIPLRAFEILGSGGFLLSNFQADFCDCYTDGVDYISYNSKDDMLEKIEYYLSHEKERSEIADNGLRRTVEEHTYEKRLADMLEYV